MRSHRLSVKPDRSSVKNRCPSNSAHPAGLETRLVLQPVGRQERVDVVNDSVGCDVIAHHDPRPVVDPD